MNTEYCSFDTRESRSRFILRRFPSILQGSVLDVGCYEAPLRELLPGVKYVGVDFAGRPDVELNLEQIERLPFEDGSFDTVLCIEVLEHLNNLHAVFAELFRVARKHVLVSLPNCWSGARQPIQRGRGDFAHYGLPLDAPKDRHKWFINATQVREFFEGQARDGRVKADLVDVFAVEKTRSAGVRALRKVLFQGEAYQNRYCHTIFGHYRMHPRETTPAS